MVLKIDVKSRSNWQCFGTLSVLAAVVAVVLCAMEERVLEVGKVVATEAGVVSLIIVVAVAVVVEVTAAMLRLLKEAGVKVILTSGQAFTKFMLNRSVVIGRSWPRLVWRSGVLVESSELLKAHVVEYGIVVVKASVVVEGMVMMGRIVVTEKGGVVVLGSSEVFSSLEKHFCLFKVSFVFFVVVVVVVIYVVGVVVVIIYGIVVICCVAVVAVTFVVAVICVVIAVICVVVAVICNVVAAGCVFFIKDVANVCSGDEICFLLWKEFLIYCKLWPPCM